MLNHLSHGPETASAPRRAPVAPRLRALLLITTALSAATTAPAWAIEWINPGVGDWFDPANWDASFVPGPFTRFEIDNGGTARVTNGGHATPYDGVIGTSLGDSGAIEITGPGTTWTSLSGLSVGYFGRGTLTVSNGATVSAGDGYSIGTQSGSTGLVIVTGAGSSLSISSGLNVGFGGTGTLDISNGGSVSAGYANIGANFGSNGVVTVDGAGSSLSTTGFLGYLIVGNSGTGTLTVSNGGTVTTGGSAFIGENAGSVGIVTVGGAGSSWTAGELRVGDSGDGTLTISNGGAVTSSDTAAIGYYAGSTGVVTVTGAGSTWTNGSDLGVGKEGHGTLTITDGGAVHTATDGYIGDAPGSTGIVTVDGAGSSWQVGHNLLVGAYGSGALTITNGGHVTSLEARIGDVDSGGTGTVVVDGVGSTWTNYDHMHLGTLATGTLTIRNGAHVDNDDDLDIGAYGRLNIGAALGQTAVAAGTLDADKINFQSGSALVFNHTDAEYDFSLPMSGRGTILQMGPGTTVLTGDASGFNGLTYVAAGTLLVDGTLAGTTYVAGTLGGTGTVGDTHMFGIIAPGHGSAGSLTVDGDLFFDDPTSSYSVDIGDGGNDLIHVTGDAYIANAHLSVVRHGAALGTYTILETDGTLYDSFDTSSLDYAFITPTLDYTSSRVNLELARNAVAFADVAATPNEASVAGAVEALGAGNTIYDAILGLNQTEAQAAYEALSGEGHATIRGMLVENSNLVRDALLGRLQTLRSSPQTSGAASGYAGEPMLSGETAYAGRVWGQLYGGLGSRAGDGNAAALSYGGGGVVLGTETEVADWQFGFSAQVGSSDFSIPDRATTGSSTDVGLGVYGGTQWGDTGFGFGASFTRSFIATTRQVQFPGFAETLTASYGATTGQVFAEIDHEVDLGNVSLTPFAQLAYSGTATDGFTETGGAAALSSSANLINSTFATLGFRAEHQFLIGEDGLAGVSGGAAWRHGLVAAPVASNAFAGGGAFTVAGTPAGADALVLEAGLSLDLANGLDVSLDYAGQIAAQGQSHGLSARIGGKF